MRRTALTLCLAALASSQSARAQSPAPPLPARVRIVPPACTEGPFDTSAWIDLVRSELETDGVESVVLDADPEARAAAAVVRLEAPVCRADADEALLSIDDELTHKSVQRRVSLAELSPSARPRALALALAELLRATWAELALPDAPDAESAPTPIRRAMLLRLRPLVLAAHSTAAPTSFFAHDLGLALDARTFPGHNAALLGARALYGWSPWARVPLRLRLDAGGLGGTSFDRYGRISLSLVSVGFGAMLTGGGERLDFALGPRLEAGWAWVEGVSTRPGIDGATGNASILLATANATFRVALAARWWALLDLSLGYTVLPLSFGALGDEQVGGLEGVVLSLGVGLGGSW